MMSLHFHRNRKINSLKVDMFGGNFLHFSCALTFLTPASKYRLSNQDIRFRTTRALV